MVLKVYGIPQSTCTSGVMATAIEKGVEFEVQIVDLHAGAHKRPEFLALQPFGVIPVLIDGDFKVFESRAIGRYIARKYENQGTPLYGKTLQEKAMVDQWLDVEAQNYNPPISELVAHLVLYEFKRITPDQNVIKQNFEKLGKVLDIYEDHLSKNEYLAGNFFSLADLFHMPYTHYLVNIANRGEVITSRKHVNAWWVKISSRPAWKKVLEWSS